MEKDVRKKVLGKGLNALITNSYGSAQTAVLEEAPQKTEEHPAEIPSKILGENVVMIPLDKIVPNPEQPRSNFPESAIEELSESIKEQGILQPVIVTQREGQYQLICGERRLRAAGLAGLEKIPAIVKEISPNKILEMALVENIQREDLNAIEEAAAYEKLAEEQKLSQEDVAKRVGKSRSTVANSLRLLRLPKEVQEMVVNQMLSAGHARALVALFTPEHQRVVAQKIVKENLSVRQTEELVQNILAGKRPAKRARRDDPYIEDLERKIEARFGTQVRIFNNRKNQGRIEIRYFSLDELDRLLELLAIKRD